MKNLVARAAIAVAVGGVFTGGPAFAGPCSDDIAALGKTLSQAPGMGPASTGTLNGSGPEAKLPSQGGAAQPASKDGTTAQGKLSGEGGTKEMTAAAGQVATSAQDVRRQQAGLPTMASDPKVASGDERMSRAKMTLEQARALDQRDDASCRDSVAEVNKLMQPG